MIVCITGSSAYLRSVALQERVQTFLEKGSLNAIERFDAPEVEYEILRESANSISFLEPQKLIIIQNGSANRRFMEKIQDFIECISDTSTVILVEPKLDKRLTYYKVLRKQTEFTAYDELDSTKLATFAVNYAKKQGSILSGKDARYLIARIGEDQLRLTNEIEKLSIAELTISQSLIDQLIDSSIEGSVFTLLDAALARHDPVEIRDEVAVLRTNEEAHKFMGLLASQIYSLALVWSLKSLPDKEIAQQTKLHPFVVQKLHVVTRKLSKVKLTNITEELSSADERLKYASGFDAWDTVELCLQKIARLSA